ncbi:MAG: DNA-protecting protein DprA [Lachnospiraceae bacterium]|nr:DNA-protecting protein DprA [Lachnospiraceae bacterium]MBO5144952.1 DNA-protecting protein DprA [Lachnospiraceae bacterium]
MMRYGMNRTERTQDSYPKQLLELAKPPDNIYFIGNIDIINQYKSIAVIGSRKVSEKGIFYAWLVGQELGKRGINVVNGLAHGCDTYAFKGALSAGGKCTAVMPCGLEQIVPRSNTGLAVELLSKGGCLISEYPVMSPIQKYQYIQRDRLQSGISGGVLVIEATYDSGTMHTVRYAIQQGKKLACIDSRLADQASGNRWMEGLKGVKVIRSIEDLDCFINELSCSVTYRQMTLEGLIDEENSERIYKNV